MEYRNLGKSGLDVSVLALGTATFGGEGPLFSNWGAVDAAQATEIVHQCLDHGINFFDTADSYSNGRSEDILGTALQGIRDKVIISTKTGLPLSDSAENAGSSSKRLVKAVDLALKRLKTEYIDLFQLHAFDMGTPTDDVLITFEKLIIEGKIGHWGVSNYPGWALMQALERAERFDQPLPVSHQVYYSLIGRDYEHELMPLSSQNTIGTVIWSPLGWGRLTGKVRRGQQLPEVSRLHKTADFAPPVSNDHLFDVVETLIEISRATGKTVPQIAINWLTRQPTVSSVIIGVRTAGQLSENLGSVGWTMSQEHIEMLENVSRKNASYPTDLYRRLDGFAALYPLPK